MTPEENQCGRLLESNLDTSAIDTPRTGTEPDGTRDRFTKQRRLGGEISTESGRESPEIDGEQRAVSGDTDAEQDANPRSNLREPVETKTLKKKLSPMRQNKKKKVKDFFFIFLN